MSSKSRLIIGGSIWKSRAAKIRIMMHPGILVSNTPHESMLRTTSGRPNSKFRWPPWAFRKSNLAQNGVQTSSVPEEKATILSELFWRGAPSRRVGHSTPRPGSEFCGWFSDSHCYLVDVGPARDQELYRPLLLLLLNQIRPAQNFRIRVGKQLDVRQHFRNRARQSVVSTYRSYRRHLQLQFFLRKLPGNLGILDHLVKVRSTSQQRIIDVVGHDARDRIYIRLVKIQFSQGGIIWRARCKQHACFTHAAKVKRHDVVSLLQSFLQLAPVGRRRFSGFSKPKQCLALFILS